MLDISGSSVNIYNGLNIKNVEFLNSSINTNVPIVRSAWTSGELIKTTIYNQTNSASGVQTITPNSNGTGTYVDWKTMTFTTLNNPTDSIIIVEVFAPFVCTGGGGDRLLSKLTDTTSTQTIAESGQVFYDTNGGGARGLSFLPVTGSYTPTNTTKTRTIKIQFDNATNDTLYICRVDVRNKIEDINYYTIKVSEHKI